MSLATFLVRIIRSAGFNRLLRGVYRQLPLPAVHKQKLKQIYLRSSFSAQPHIAGILGDEVFREEHYRKALPLIAASARLYDPADPWVLVVELRVPVPDQDSGSVRMAAIIRLLKEMGFRITFISDSEEGLPQYRKVLEKQGIDVIWGFRAGRNHLEAAGGKYHFVVLSRPEVAFRYLFIAKAYAVYATIIYDTVDLHWVRLGREMQVSGDCTLRDAIARYRHVELFNSESADLVLAITDEEKERLLLEKPGVKVAVLPNIHELYPPVTSYGQRKGLLFIGGFLHKPNEDAVMYFVREIMPCIVEQIPDVVFYIIGSNMPDSIKSLGSANVHPLGFVAEVAPYFESCRVFVAPLRFGAGMKGKVGQSMSHGLPVVATPIGAEGMGLRHGRHALIASGSQDFADSVVRLYEDEALWRGLSAESFAYLEANYSPAAAREKMAGIFNRVQNNDAGVDVLQDPAALAIPLASSA
ncbi:MAG: glycosyltransferase [Nitrosospira sp.]